MIYIYDEKEYPITIIRKRIKNTYIRYKNNSIVVTTNYMVSDKKINKLISDNKSLINSWIETSKQNKKDDGLYIFGVRYDVIYGSFSDVSIMDNRIYVKDENNLNKYLNNLIKKTFKEHLDYWYNRYEKEIPNPNLKIRNMKSRWGVCNIKNNNVTLNSNLIKYDIDCLDYVIVHELSHFIHFNHSKEFWNEVSIYIPNYKEIRKKLRN